MIVYLTKVIGQMSGKMDQQKLRACFLFKHQKWMFFIKLCNSHVLQYRSYDEDGFFNHCDQLLNRHIFLRKFLLAIPQITGVSHLRTDICIQIANKMQTKIAAGVFDLFICDPDVFFASVC